MKVVETARTLPRIELGTIGIWSRVGRALYQLLNAESQKIAVVANDLHFGRCDFKTLMKKK